MSSTPSLQAGLATSHAALDRLRASAARDPRAAIRDTARQFEALFMNELMKSMRATTLGSGWFDNNGSELATGMLDSQYATQMAGLPGGLGDMIARQLERQLGGALAGGAGRAPTPIPLPASGGAGPAAGAPAASSAAPQPRIPPQADAEGFVRHHAQAAQAAQADTGIPAAFILAQAAHESGWGRKEIHHADGSPSHNLFGIKAGADWRGATAEVTTTEYIDGRPRKVTEKFRAYASYEESFRDWARLLSSSPRYAGLVRQVAQVAGGAEGAQAFAQGLQRAGYATDPHYADKLGRVINTTLRLQRPT
jgi:flagellar protein FlgJ